MSNFVYMSGTGNDFIVGDYIGDVSDIQIIALVSDSEIDVDGVIFVEKLNSKEVKMHYFNNDGTKAELCVNGVRCTAKYALDNDLVDSDKFFVLAPIGSIPVSIYENIVEIEAPIPIYDNNPISIGNLKGIASTVGNPHFLIEVDSVKDIDLPKLNRDVVASGYFPQGVNIEIYQVLENNFINARVYERGVGETDACGSGALCMFNYLYKEKLIDSEGIINYPGGDISLRFENEKLYLSGEVRYL
ncbi:MAG: diaminopimelate epimerase [Actinomycetota bacterium]|nr:diaminopimelate epimerase [Actinomycetota bacterium]MDA3013398.1 diaminopimelate epimerase [Actinomycetota bacterium]